MGENAKAQLSFDIYHILLYGKYVILYAVVS